MIPVIASRERLTNFLSQVRTNGCDDMDDFQEAFRDDYDQHGESIFAYWEMVAARWPNNPLQPAYDDERLPLGRTHEHEHCRRQEQTEPDEGSA